MGSYSFINSDTRVEGNGGESMPGSFYFLNGASAPTWAAPSSIILENAQTRRLYGSVADNGSLSTPSTTVNIDYRDAEYFTYTIAASDITLRFSQWPSATGGLYAKVRVDVTNNGTSRDITWATTSGTVIFDTGLSSLYSVDGSSSVHHVFEAWTTDGGNNVYLTKVGKFS